MKTRKEEEKEILAQMDEAMKENKAKEGQVKRVGPFQDKTPNQIHCHKCNTLMENGKCPTCGHTIYMPMDEKKQKTIRWILGGICAVAFIVVVILMK